MNPHGNITQMLLFVMGEIDKMRTTRSGREILTYPVRDKDDPQGPLWFAVDTGFQPGNPVGAGASEDEACADLIVQQS